MQSPLVHSFTNQQNDQRLCGKKSLMIVVNWAASTLIESQGAERSAAPERSPVTAAAHITFHPACRDRRTKLMRPLFCARCVAVPKKKNRLKNRFFFTLYFYLPSTNSVLVAYRKLLAKLLQKGVKKCKKKWRRIVQLYYKVI